MLNFSINGNNSFFVLCFVLLQLFHDNIWNIFVHLLQGLDDSTLSVISATVTMIMQSHVIFSVEQIFI